MRLKGARSPLHLVSGFAGFVLVTASLSLTGCQSSQDQRIEDAKELIRQKQVLDAQAGRTGVNIPAIPAATTPPRSPDPSNAGKAATPDSPGLPVYPGATSVSHLPNTGDGISMDLLETNDKIDGVLAFYQEKLKSATGKVPPTTTEEKRDGRRVVRISLPRDDGGLLTAEVGEGAGKTTIQLMNVNPGKSALARPGSAGDRVIDPALLPPPPTGTTLPLPPPPRP